MTTTHPRFGHVMLVHDGPDELAGELAPVVTGALAAGESVLVCIDERSWRELATRLGDQSRHVRFVPAGARYVRPAVALRVLLDAATAAVAAGAPSLWSIGTIPFDGEHDAEWLRYEAAIDQVVDHLPIRGVCTYDVATVPARLVDAARRSHTEVQDAGTLLASAAYVPCSHVDAASIPVPARPPDVADVVRSPGAARAALRAACTDRLPSDVLGDLLLVASELVTNVDRHGEGPATVRIWCDPGRVVIEVHERGAGTSDPYFDLRPPAAGGIGGAGLWVVGQVMDRVRVVRHDDATSSVVAERSLLTPH